MPDVLGYRAKIGVLVPSTNTVVEPDLYAMGPPGVTFHVSRIYIEDPRIDSDQRFEYLMHQIRENLEVAVKQVLTCEPDYLIMGMSSETFWGGLEGNRRLMERIGKLSGLRVAAGSNACARALQVLGCRRIAVLSPYQPVGDSHVGRFFEECGFTVVRSKGLRCRTAVEIARVDESVLREALGELNGPDIDAVVQVGTNLSMVRLADEAERWLGRPVLAINAVTLWYALRDCGINDRVRGFGVLLREY
jgi:maleate isomerase